MARANPDLIFLELQPPRLRVVREAVEERVVLRLKLLDGLQVETLLHATAATKDGHGVEFGDLRNEQFARAVHRVREEVFLSLKKINAM